MVNKEHIDFLYEKGYTNIEDINNDMVDSSEVSQYRQKLVIKLDELYEKLNK